MTDFDDLDDLDFAEVSFAKSKVQADIQVSVVTRREKRSLYLTFAAHLIDELGANRFRVEWNALRAVYRLTADDAAPCQISRFARSDRRHINIPFPADDLHEAEGVFAAEFKINHIAKCLLVRVPQALIDGPKPKPKLLPAPPAAPARPVAHLMPPAHPADEPLDDAKVVRAALGIPAEIVPTEIGGQKFTRQESQLVLLLFKRELVTIETFLFATAEPGQEDDDKRDGKILDVYIHKVRPKLHKIGVNVATKWGNGYGCSAPDRKKLSGLIASAREDLS